MAGLFGDFRGGGPIGLFGRPRGIGEEERRQLAEFAMVAGELGGSLPSQGVPGGAVPQPSGESFVPPAQLAPLTRHLSEGGGGLPGEPRSYGSPLPMSLAGDANMLGLQGAAGGGFGRSPIGGLRAEAEGYADRVAQRGTPQWGSAVRDFVMQGPAGSRNLAVRPDEDLPGGGLGSAAEEGGPSFGLGSAALQSGEFGQAEAEAGSLRPAALWQEGEGSPTHFMRLAAFQGGASERAVNRATRSQTAPEKASTPDEPWIVQNGRYVPNPNWRNPAPNLEYYAAFGPPLAGLAAAAPAIPSIYGLSRADLIRYGPTDIPNVIAKGPGVPGRTKAPALKGGGKDMPFHYHIHRYNWNRPWEWFKHTDTVKGKPPP